MSLAARLTWVEVKLFLREPLAVVFAFAYPLFVLFILGGVFGNDVKGDSESVRVWRGVGPAQYYLPAYVGLVMAALGLITLPMRIASYRESGVLRRFRAAGIPLRAFVGSQIAVMLVMAAVGAISVTVFSMVVYGTTLPVEWPHTLVAFAMGLLTFGAVGVVLGATLPSARATQGAGLLLFFAMMLISGAGPPRGVLTEPMRIASDGLPLTHVVLMLQAGWLGSGWDGPASAMVAIFLAGSLALAWRFFRWE